MKKKYGLPGCTDEKGYPRTGLMIRYLTKGFILREVLKLLEFISQCRWLYYGPVDTRNTDISSLHNYIYISTIIIIIIMTNMTIQGPVPVSSDPLAQEVEIAGQCQSLAWTPSSLTHALSGFDHGEQQINTHYIYSLQTSIVSWAFSSSCTGFSWRHRRLEN